MCNFQVATIRRSESVGHRFFKTLEATLTKYLLPVVKYEFGYYLWFLQHEQLSAQFRKSWICMQMPLCKGVAREYTYRRHCFSVSYKLTRNRFF